MTAILRTRTAKITFFLFLATVCLAADAPQPELPAKAILPTRAYNTALEQAKARYNREVDQARREYLRDLERAKAEYMRDGNLDGATAVQRLIDKEQPRTVTVPATNNRKDPVSAGTIDKGRHVTIIPVEGRWSGGGTKSGTFTDWSGYSPDKPWMVLHGMYAGKAFPIRERATFVAEQDGELLLYCNDDDPRGNEGEVKVSVIVR